MRLIPVSDFAERLLASRSQVYSQTGRRSLVRAGRRRRLRRHRLRLHRARGRAVHLRALHPDAEPRQRQGRRHRGRRAWSPSRLGVSREVLDSHYLLQIALLDPACHAELERQFILPNFDIALSTRQAAHRRLSRHPRPGGPPAGRPPLCRPREARCAEGLRRDGRTGGARAPRAGRRVRLAQLLPAQRRVLRLAGREAGLRALARQEPADLQDGGIRRAERRVLPASGFQGPRLDRPPALSHQGPRVAPRRARTRSSA